MPKQIVRAAAAVHNRFFSAFYHSRRVFIKFNRPTFYGRNPTRAVKKYSIMLQPRPPEALYYQRIPSPIEHPLVKIFYIDISSVL